MKRERLAALFLSCAMMAACGGGGGGGGGGAVAVAPPPPAPPVSPPPPPPPVAAACSLRDRQDWAAGQLREWYLFPETLPATLDPTPFTTVQDYIDALTATARGQQRDRFFTYIASIREDEAFFSSGSSAGFGFRLATDPTARRVFVAEAFEGAPALAVGIDRGTEIVGVGNTAADVRTVSAILASEGSAGLSNAFGPSTAGTTRVLRISNASGARDVAVTKTDFSLPPVSTRYGVQVLNDGGRSVGYLNLRTFISTADPALREAFGRFRSLGITEVIIDLRYNGGGLVSTAELMVDLLGRDRTGAEVQGFTTFRPEKASNNSTRLFRPQAESIAPTRIAFIGTGSTASASELVINAMIPYLGPRAALIGGNTFGKPVGQIALDRAACDDRLRPVAFATQNSARQSEYYTGLASTVQASCRATDDILQPLGSPQEASTRAALDFLAGRPCTPIAAGTASAKSTPNARALPTAEGPTLLSPERPTPAQREVPGLF